MSEWKTWQLFPRTLTDHHQDEDEGGHPSADVEHDSDVVRQLIHVVHIRHQDGWDQKPNSDAHLQVRGPKLEKDAVPSGDDHTPPHTHTHTDAYT